MAKRDKGYYDDFRNSTAYLILCPRQALADEFTFESDALLHAEAIIVL